MRTFLLLLLALPAWSDGRELYVQYCQECHERIGNAPSITTGPPSDLRKPQTYKHGSDERSMFKTVKLGIPYTGMAPVPLKDREIREVVRYVRSIQVNAR